MSTKNNSAELQAMRHSLAHIMAGAIQQLWPKAKFGVGPVIEDGFYYDVDLDRSLTPEDLAKIEAKMRTIIKADHAFELTEMDIDKAIAKVKKTGQEYKVELLGDLKKHGSTSARDIDATALGVEGNADKVTTVTFYKSGDFEDLCRGPHVDSTGKVGAFKLTKVSGAYWRGKQDNPQMQRVYGLGFATQPELDDYLAMLVEAEKRDHRKLGRELDLFVTSPLIGSGLPLFTPRGTIMRELLNDLSQEYRLKRGYQKVWIPAIAKLETYKKSGHFEKFPELLWFKSLETGDELALKPVNCPHHAMIYASRPRSYRELPVKYLETTTVYRDERSGEMSGLNRVRAITQDDSHVFCTEEQVKEVFSELVEDAQDIYKRLDLQLSLRLSFRDDSDAYLGDKKAWEKAQQTLTDLAKKFNIPHVVAEGDAAIYGPKMDFMATDALGRETQLATVQLDYAQPERFGLVYTAKDGSEQRPVMVHAAFLGSLERFLSIYIEHTAGKFPVWLAPEQVRVATVNDDQAILNYAAKVVSDLREAGVRAELDDGNESVGKKIRAAELAKVPYTIVVGDKEVESGEVMPRVRGDLAVGETKARPLGQFIETVANESHSRTNRSSL